MTTDPGVTDNPRLLLQFQVMRALAAAPSDGFGEGEEIAQELGVTGREVGDIFDRLGERRLADVGPLMLAPGYSTEAALTGHGRDQVAGWDSAQRPGQLRRACTAAMLGWLDAHSDEDVGSTDEFAGDVRAHYYGLPFADGTLRQAAAELKEHGLIKGVATASGPIVRPQITGAGEAVLARFGGNLAEWVAAESAPDHRGDTIHITNSTGVTVAHRSAGAQQSVHVSTDAREQVLNLAAALRQTSPVLGLEPIAQAQLAGLTGQLEEAAQAGPPEPGRLRSLLESVKQIAVSGSGAAAGTGIVALAEAIAQGL